MIIMFEKIKNIFKKTKKEKTKEEIEKELYEKQEAINKKYEQEGLTDEVLEEQVKLNQLRNKLDIPDSTKRIYENFVQ